MPPCIVDIDLEFNATKEGRRGMEDEYVAICSEFAADQVGDPAVLISFLRREELFTPKELDANAACRLAPFGVEDVRRNGGGGAHEGASTLTAALVARIDTCRWSHVPVVLPSGPDFC